MNEVDIEVDDVQLEIRSPALVAITTDQLNSIAELPKKRKYSLFETINIDDLSNYHRISCRPITVAAENDMELISDIVTWGERYLHHWLSGSYCCSKCLNPLYHSRNKYKGKFVNLCLSVCLSFFFTKLMIIGPCVWPSFRKPINEKAISSTIVFPYNNYKITVKEVYCNNCNLFVGHQFEDAREKGDTHPDAHWRH